MAKKIKNRQKKQIKKAQKQKNVMKGLKNKPY